MTVVSVSVFFTEVYKLFKGVDLIDSPVVNSFLVLELHRLYEVLAIASWCRVGTS